jgi:hypothetical protein
MESPTFWETLLLLTVKRQDFCTHLFLFYAKYGLDPAPNLDPESEPEPEPKLFQSRNRNKSLPTGTVPFH